MASTSLAPDTMNTPGQAEIPVAAEPALSATDKVSEAIIQGIRSGVFVPGQHLLEPDLTRRLSISRGSLREALKHLAAAGIVTLNRYRGAYIGILDKKSVLDLLDTLEPLARLAARLAAQKWDNAELQQQLVEAVELIEHSGGTGNRARYLEYRRRFYDAMIQMGGNRELERVMPLSRTDLFRAQVETVQSEEQRMRHVSGYRRIAEAILARDADEADAAVKHHFGGTRQTMDELPETAFPALDN